MARLLGCLVLLLSAAILVPAWAQDKKDAAKDKKEPAKADKDKKRAKDDDDEPKKDAKSKKAKEPEERVEYGQKVKGKLKSLEANTQRDFTIEIPVLDKKKIVEMELWKQKELIAVAQAAPQDRAQRLAQFQAELLRKTANLYSPQDLELRRADNMKVRSMYPPVLFDDKGFMKKWTAKELAALKGNSKLPGYPADAEEALKAGQFVEVYLAKTKTPPPKAKGKAAPKLDDDDDLRARPEVVMIVILAEPPRQPER